MTVPRINSIARYHKEICPPAVMALAASIGFKPGKRDTQEVNKNVEEFFSAFPQHRGSK